MSKQIIRIKSGWGFQRLEIDPTKTTLLELRHKIAFNNKIEVNQFTMHPDEARAPALSSIHDKKLISQIPELQENGIEIYVKEKPGVVQKQQIDTEPPKQQYKKSAQCNHGPNQRCVNCESTDKKQEEVKPKKCLHGPKQKCVNCLGATNEQKDEKDENKMEVEGENKGDKKVGQKQTNKCYHGPGGKCVNCITIDKNKDSIKEGMKQNCQHGPHGKCIHCMDSEFISSAKHQQFDQFWFERTLKCKNTHPKHEKCPYCTPFENMSYKVKRDCKNHAPFPKSMCAHCIPPSITLKRQAYRHIDFCSIMNVKEIGGLVSHWIKKDFQEQRFGFLYGYYAEDPNYPLGIRAVVEAVFEPKQHGDVSGYVVMEDPLKESADRIATSLGLELIGQIYTNINHDVHMSSQEVRQAARYQSDYRVDHQTGYKVSKFITCILRTGKQNPNDVAPEVYMVSDQAQDMERDNIFADAESRKVLKIREPKDENDIIPTVLSESKPVKDCDPSWFVVNIGCGNMPDTRYNVLKHHDFPVCNRQEDEQNITTLKKYLSRYKNEPSYVRFSSFHLLVFLANFLDIDTACTIAQYVSEEKEIPKQTLEFIDTMLSHYN
ncbi:hypothetical protein PPERSA_11767 [Pseudocohnilembus persalinus]|uniref:MPN domain-containing protein n=1 Tax=Pseudocohnilembus persalinus TaxID=266149 RepID=A0A0V0QGQ7_PSEPJ|nr:hypothetical protein PPERSA_11767 [Pseudocohnilembus persalinus]|eukprot:KRX01320.1 hypothetical protein PPERSA_11767 [Pseudocohnilembus persalinus]